MLRYNFTLLTLVSYWKGMPLIVGGCGYAVGQCIWLVLPTRQYVWWKVSIGYCLLCLVQKWLWWKHSGCSSWMSRSDRPLFLHGAAWQLKISDLGTWLTKAWYQLMVERKIDTQGLAENSPQQHECPQRRLTVCHDAGLVARLDQIWAEVFNSWSNSWFSLDVIATMLEALNKETTAMLVPKVILRKLNSIFMQSFFV